MPSISLGTEPNTFRLSSDRGALPNALVVVVNRNVALTNDERVDGTIADDQGSWDLVLRANVGDVVDVSQESGAARSAPVTVTLK